MDNKKINLIILGMIMLVISIWNLYLIGELNRQNEMGKQTAETLAIFEDRISQLNQDLSQQKIDKEQLINRISTQVDLLKSQSTLNEMMIEKLNQEGIEEPKNIVSDLLKQSELIPYEGVLGGTMFISRAWLLTDRYALAEFEDGHVLGYMILEFEIDHGDIKWTVLDAQLDN